MKRPSLDRGSRRGSQPRLEPIALACALALALGASAFSAAAAAATENILILLADDLGVDALSTYGRQADAAPTPNISALAARGVTFTNAWSHTICAPSRASLLTGLLPSDHGISHNPQNGTQLDPTIPTFADTARLRGYQTFAIGKWHLVGPGAPMTHPLEMGFQHHTGTLRNPNYFSWDGFVDGVEYPNQQGYLTTSVVDETLAHIAITPEPWLAYVAFHAPHVPYHAPPQHLHGYALSGDPNESRPEHFRAATEALDSEIGRLLASIDPAVLARTTIVFAGDNGTPGAATTAPADPERAKGTPYRGGVEVPLIVAGPIVPTNQHGSERHGLVQLEDIHATIVDRLGRPDLIGSDAYSFLSALTWPSLEPRRVAISQYYSPVRDQFAVARGCHKLVRPALGIHFELYDLCVDPDELTPILPDQGNREERRALRELSAMVPFVPQCADGIDNDGDGAIDAGDPGCADADSDWEAPACSDGIDNDGDGKIDFDGGGVGAPDPLCAGDASGLAESLRYACGLGFEGGLAVLWIAALRMRRRRRAPVNPGPRRASAAIAALIASSGAAPARADNFLVLLADDLGIDNIGAYARSPHAPPTPNIDALAARGVRFERAWSNPNCSAARASLLTGLFARNSGVGANPEYSGGLDPDTLTIADLLKTRGYATFAVGKWHLAPPYADMHHPLAMGFEHHAGARGNLGKPMSYSNWTKYVDGKPFEHTRTYATTDTADEAIARIAIAEQPWFAYVAFNATHKPFAAPPAALYDPSFDDAVPPGTPRYYRAMVQALDREIGRLIAQIPPSVLAETTIVFAGDNGTPRPAILPRELRERAKGSAYEDGIHVPLIVSGNAVAPSQRGATSDALVHIADVFATLGELAGASLPPSDALSFAPQLVDAAAPGRRRWLAAERFGDSRDSSAVVLGCRKLVVDGPPTAQTREFYDLCADPEEQVELISALERPGALDPARAAELRADLAILQVLAVETPECANARDDDGDGRVDVDDPDCLNEASRSESGPSEPPLLADPSRGVWIGLAVAVAAVLGAALRSRSRAAQPAASERR